MGAWISTVTAEITERKVKHVRSVGRRAAGIVIGLPETSEKLTPWKIETRERALRISMPARSASLSADPVFNPKFYAKVDIRSLKKTEVVSEKVLIWRKKFGNQRLTIRLGADSIRNERADRDITGSD